MLSQYCSPNSNCVKQFIDTFIGQLRTALYFASNCVFHSRHVSNNLFSSSGINQIGWTNDQLSRLLKTHGTQSVVRTLDPISVLSVSGDESTSIVYLLYQIHYWSRSVFLFHITSSRNIVDSNRPFERRFQYNVGSGYSFTRSFGVISNLHIEKSVFVSFTSLAFPSDSPWSSGHINLMILVESFITFNESFFWSSCSHLDGFPMYLWNDWTVGL